MMIFYQLLRLNFNLSVAFFGLLITLFPFFSAPVWSQTIEPEKNLCHPEIDPGKKQYIIGYGSLMQGESRKRTAPNAGEAFPVWLKGYRRGWFVSGRPIGFSTTFLGVIEDQAQELNAVIYQVFESGAIAATDKREGAYCRQSVPPEKVHFMKSEIPKPEGEIWIYTLKKSSAKLASPNAQFPIVQSYVDIFLSGCLEQAEKFDLPDFPQQCIQTTTNWSTHWVNDRLYPRRPFLEQPKAFQIDNLLNRLLPDYFQQIKIE